jgi:hypothetical protein
MHLCSDYILSQNILRCFDLQATVFSQLGNTGCFSWFSNARHSWALVACDKTNATPLIKKTRNFEQMSESILSIPEACLNMHVLSTHREFPAPGAEAR